MEDNTNKKYQTSAARASMKPAKKLNGFVAVAILLIIMASSYFFVQIGTKKTAEPHSSAAAFQSKKSLDDLKGKIVRVFDQTNPKSYTFFYDDNNAVLNLWSDKTKKTFVQKAVTEDARLVWWNENLKHISASCDEVQKWFDDGGHPEITAVINLVDYSDHSTVFACCARGKIIYDAVAEARSKQR